MADLGKCPSCGRPGVYAVKRCVVEFWYKHRSSDGEPTGYRSEETLEAEWLEEVRCHECGNPRPNLICEGGRIVEKREGSDG